MSHKIGLPGLLIGFCCLFGSPTNVSSIATAHAQATDSEHRPQHHGPSPEMVAACSSLAASAACKVTFGPRTVDGTCRVGHDGTGPLACMPNHPHGPPPEAVAACSTLAASAACTVTFGDHTMTGVCRAAHDGNGPLHCAPSGPPPANR